MATQAVKQVICAVRGGPESRETVIQAISLALETGARLTFFHIMDAEFLGYATIGTLRIVYDELEEMGKFVMLILCDRARARGVTHVDYNLQEGNIREQLRKLAILTGAEVMVMGRPTRSHTKNVFKSEEFDTFVANLEQDANIRIIKVTPAPIDDKDLQSGLVL